MQQTRLAPLDARVPARDLQQLQPRSCPVCGGIATDEVVERPDNLAVVRCSKCRTYYVSPAPTAAALDEFYAG